ncbi:hypothetical protein B0H10DRAFT_1939161 [Mycena sp. CBHHK59/15]|nr:hypothetical protein B0H10DRAFT_1939161 [Mycena sp. CBHHK59/15]
MDSVDAGQPTTAPQRVEDLWFDDGSLVIQAEQSLFRVYRAVLALRSPVFKDMLSFPQPPDAELIEGCPVVHLPDTAADVTVFLKAIFDSGFFEPYPAQTEFSIVAGNLRLSNKYQVDYLRRRALVHLSSAFHTTLTSYDARDSESSPTPSFPVSDLTAYDHIVVIELAREVEALWLLPYGFYILAASFDEELVNRTLYDGINMLLSEADAKSFIRGSHRQNDDATGKVLRFLHFPPRIQGCTGAHNCAISRLDVLEVMRVDRTENHSIPLDIWNSDDWELLSDLCGTCLISLTRTHQEARQEFWDQLPEMYGLPGWDELKQMKKSALEDSIAQTFRLGEASQKNLGAGNGDSWRGFRLKDVLDVVPIHLSMGSTNQSIPIIVVSRSVYWVTSTSMEVDAEPPVPQRVEELWFEDSGLVIQAENSLFRVSGSLLATRSPVFKDMLSFPQPPESETVDGCAVVHFPDCASDVVPFLRAIFDSSFFEPYPAPTDLDTIISILRLSNKYAVDYLRRRAFTHLSSEYVTTLSAYNEASVTLSPWKKPSFPDPSTAGVIAVISVAREVDALWILPVAFYMIATTKEDLIQRALNCTMYNKQPAKLSDFDRILFLKSAGQINVAGNDIVRFLYFPDVITGCKAGQLCLRARLLALERVRVALANESDSNPLHVCDSAFWKSLKEACCNICVTSLKTTHMAAQQAFWDKLPEIFGLPPWKQLEEMKQSALGNSII